MNKVGFAEVHEGLAFVLWDECWLQSYTILWKAGFTAESIVYRRQRVKACNQQKDGVRQRRFGRRIKRQDLYTRDFCRRGWKARRVFALYGICACFARATLSIVVFMACSIKSSSFWTLSPVPVIWARRWHVRFASVGWLLSCFSSTHPYCGGLRPVPALNISLKASCSITSLQQSFFWHQLFSTLGRCHPQRLRKARYLRFCFRNCFIGFIRTQLEGDYL